MISAGFVKAGNVNGLRVHHVVKAAAGHGMYGVVTGMALPTSNRDVGVEGIDVHSEAAPPRPFRRDQSRSTPQEWIENDFTARGAVQDRIGDHLNRLDRRMKL
jgi:hypothetical protein